jgi:hypothetical protein
MAFGTFGGLLTGLAQPACNILMGEVLDSLNSNPDSFSDRIGILCIAFVVIAVVNIFSGFLQVLLLVFILSSMIK